MRWVLGSLTFALALVLVGSPAVPPAALGQEKKEKNPLDGQERRTRRLARRATRFLLHAQRSAAVAQPHVSPLGDRSTAGCLRRETPTTRGLCAERRLAPRKLLRVSSRSTA